GLALRAVGLFLRRRVVCATRGRNGAGAATERGSDGATKGRSKGRWGGGARSGWSTADRGWEGEDRGRVLRGKSRYEAGPNHVPNASFLAPKAGKECPDSVRGRSGMRGGGRGARWADHYTQGHARGAGDGGEARGGEWYG